MVISSRDVAKVAGVSQSTVSRVLNNPDSVSLKARKKVIAAMKELDYHPNLIARSLVTRNTNTIALIAGSLKNDFYVETTDSIIESLIKQGYQTLVYFIDEEQQLENIHTLLGNKVDGVILSSIMLEDPLFNEIEKLSLPYMFFNRKSKYGGNYIVLDNVKAAEKITNHMIELGHEKIAYISGDADNISTFHERKTGFENVMKQHGLTLNADYIHYINTNSDEVNAVTRKMMALPQPPTSIICTTDAMAFDCMDTLLSMNIRIPEEVSISGIDNIKKSSHHSIQLTTISPYRHDMGKLAAESLVAMIHSEDDNREYKQVVLEPELIKRKTTDKRKD